MTNALRHAAGATVRVEGKYRPDLRCESLVSVPAVRNVHAERIKESPLVDLTALRASPVVPTYGNST